MEKANLQRAYKSLAKQSVTIFNKKLGYVMLEQFLMKYGWAGTGMITMAIPIFTSREDSASVGDNIAGKAFEMVTKYVRSCVHILAIRVVEFLSEGYKIRNSFS